MEGRKCTPGGREGERVQRGRERETEASGSVGVENKHKSFGVAFPVSKEQARPSDR